MQMLCSVPRNPCVPRARVPWIPSSPPSRSTQVPSTPTSVFNAYKLHAFLLKTGLLDDPLHLRRLLLACAAGAPQSLSYARSLFANIPSPDTFAYNTLIRAHAPSSPSHALSLFSQMRLAGVSPDAFTFPFVLKACARLQLGQGLHSLIIKLAFDFDIYVQNSLISFYGCFGSVELASKLFQEMLQRDLVSWSSMIACLANNGFGLQALDLFRQMQLSASEDIKPDEITMLSVISAVSSLGALDLGQWVYTFIRRSGLELSVSLGTALVDMYSRCGSIEESIRVFDEMPIRNLLTWTALINGLAVHGRGREALRVFYEMEKSGLRPDNITLTAVLVACSHGGLVEEGRQVFESIRNTYDMEPLPEHYGCMVDLLGRAGLLYEAYDFLKRMTMKPNSVTWRTLLGACVNHNHLELAEKVKQRISELDPHHDGDYVLLSNAYGVVGRWVEKEGVRNLMREKKISKNPGYSVIIIDQVIHEFVSGDSSHPQSEEIRTFLVSVIENLRPAGYTPHTCNVLHDIEEEDKEHSLGYHSEKMAIAFALLRSNDSRTIRIMKNLRICHDCHSFMKHVSNTFGREIIIRDRNRFHHFVRGSCSCGNYW